MAKGGKRENAGRKRIGDNEEISKSRTVRLTDSEYEQFKERGGVARLRQLLKENKF